jgi:hypothetical protein
MNPDPHKTKRDSHDEPPPARSFLMNTRPSPLSFAIMLVRAQRRHQAMHAPAVFARQDGTAPSDMPTLNVAARCMVSASPSAPQAAASR